MTGQEQPEINQRRRVRRLRVELGLDRVPTYVGAELQAAAVLITAQVEARLASEVPRYAVLAPDGQRQLIAAITRAIEEFARIVEERPFETPTADVMLVDSINEVDHPERFILALHTALELTRTVMREFWARLPHSRQHSLRLDAALTGYAERLCGRTMSGFHLIVTGPRAERRAEEARLGGLFTLVERRWGGTPTQLCVRVRALAPPESRPPASLHHGHGDPRDAPRPLRLVATDHIVTITKHPTPAPRGPRPQPARPAQPVVALWVGPVSAGEVEAAYETALLLFRVVGAGIAAPPPPALLPLPSLGFLRPRPNQATVAQIRALLEPLTKQSVHRRVTLARTMQLRLRTAGTAQALADQLGMHPQSVRNHLNALRGLYDNPDLDFGRDTLATQAALDLVVPLWELEATGRASSASRPAAPPPDRRTRPKPPPEGEDLP